MYRALYRKYRPSSFDDLIDQDVVKQTLTNAIINNKISHAYLFCGPRGIGKTSVAKIFGKIINCENLDGVTPCDNCNFCIQYNEGQLNDIIEIDAASNNGVDEIRELKSKVSLMPSIGKYKVYIIDEVHMLTTGAFNALLKTLEEPPSHAIFILATTEVHKIPETIISRCQKFDFKKISNEKLCERLKYISDKEEIEVTNEALNCIAEISCGGMRDAIGLLDEVSAYANKKITIDDVLMISGSIGYSDIKEFMNWYNDGNITAVLEKINEYKISGKNIKILFEQIINYLRNVLIVNQAKEYAKNKLDNINLFENEKIGFDELIKMIKVFSNYLSDLKKYSIPSMALELAFFELIASKNVKNTNKCLYINNEDKKENKNMLNGEIEESKDSINKNEGLNKIKKVDEKFEIIREGRINNTLANFDKKKMLVLKKKFEELKPLVLNYDISEYVSLILDGEIKAASDDHIIFVCPNEGILKNFDDNISQIEKIIEKQIQKYYKVVGTTIISWEIIKKEFNSKKKKYIYKEIDDSLIYNSIGDVDPMTKLFGNIVEVE